MAGMPDTGTIAIDVGGTFTDIVVHETGPDGARVHIGKVPTTLPNQTDGVLAAIAEAGVVPADLDLLIPSVFDRQNFEYTTKLVRNDGTDGAPTATYNPKLMDRQFIVWFRGTQ